MVQFGYRKALSLVFAYLIVASVARANPVTCQDANDTPILIASALYELYLESDYANFSMNTVPCLQGGLSHLDIIRSPQNMPTHCGNEPQHLGNNQCDVPQYGGTISSVADEFVGSRCHWSYEIDFDEMRFPKYIAKAVCSCSHCHRGTCRPLNSYVPILKKECNIVTGKFEYRKYIQEVPVGCACVPSQVARRSFVMSE